MLAMRSFLICLFVCAGITGRASAANRADDVLVPEDEVAIYRAALLDRYVCTVDDCNDSGSTYIIKSVSTWWKYSTSATPSFTPEKQACVNDLSLEFMKDTTHRRFSKQLVEGTVFRLVDEKQAQRLRERCKFAIFEFSEIMLDPSNRHAMFWFNGASTSRVVVVEHTKQGWRVDKAMSDRCTGVHVIADHACPQR